ncbi:DUF2784 domain-containing protein [Planctomicrobium sp. SH661]|uniref:DUF2784 domain-containing protein n=1 Tax=Planctomicrobium sp. SH661 TaxID=3448124 RepID=UPI003F5AFA82
MQHWGLKLAADTVLVLHVSYVSFVVFGLLLIVIGGLLRWKWVRNPWFRFAHLAAIAIVVTEAWLQIPCPLTIWENSLREMAGQEHYGQSFVATWLHRILFFDLPHEFFTVAYSLFGATVLLACVLVPPQLPSRSRNLT